MAKVAERGIECSRCPGLATRPVIEERELPTLVRIRERRHPGVELIHGLEDSFFERLGGSVASKVRPTKRCRVAFSASDKSE